MSKLIQIGTTFTRFATAVVGRQGQGQGRLLSGNLSRLYSSHTEDPSGGGGEPWIPPYEQVNWQF